MDAQSIMQGLIQRGYPPVQAAALVGNILQESGGNPANVNPREGAHGFLQWEGDRWTNLQNFARSRGVPVDDPNMQMDFIGHELSGSEGQHAQPFMAAPNVNAAAAALKPYIRWGDNSDANRAAMAQNVYSGGTGNVGGRGGGGGAGPTQPSSVAEMLAGGASPDDEASQPAPDMSGISKMLAQRDQENAPPPLQPLQMAQPMLTPAMLRARMLAAAMINQPLPGTGTGTDTGGTSA